MDIAEVWVWAVPTEVVASPRQMSTAVATARPSEVIGSGVPHTQVAAGATHGTGAEVAADRRSTALQLGPTSLVSISLSWRGPVVVPDRMVGDAEGVAARAG